MSTSFGVTKDYVFNNTITTTSDKIPVYASLSIAGSDSGMQGNIAFQQSDGKFYGHNGTTWVPFDGSGGGTVTGGANEGGQVEVFDSFASTASTLVFRTLQANGNITLTQDNLNGKILIAASGAAVTLDTLLPSQQSIVPGPLPQNGPNLTLKGLNAGTGITLTDNGTNVEISETPVIIPNNIAFYVDQNPPGSDTNDGLTPGTAFATLERAFLAIRESGWNDTAIIYLVGAGAALSTTTINSYNVGSLGKQQCPVHIIGDRSNVFAPLTIATGGAALDPVSDLLELTVTTAPFTQSNVGMIVKFTSGPLATYVPLSTDVLTSFPRPPAFQLECFISSVVNASTIRLAFADYSGPLAALDGSTILVTQNSIPLTFSGTATDINAAVVRCNAPLVLQDIVIFADPATSTLTDTPINAVIFDGFDITLNGVVFKTESPLSVNPNVFKINVLGNVNGNLFTANTPINLSTGPILPTVLGFAVVPFLPTTGNGNCFFVRPTLDSSSVSFVNSVFKSNYNQVQGQINLTASELGTGSISATSASTASASASNITKCRLDGSNLASFTQANSSGNAYCAINKVHVVGTQSSGIQAGNNGTVSIDGPYLVDNCNIGLEAQQGGLVIVNYTDPVSGIIGPNNNAIAFNIQNTARMIVNVDVVNITGTFNQIFNINRGELVLNQNIVFPNNTAIVNGTCMSLFNGSIVNANNIETFSTNADAINVNNGSQMNVANIKITGGQNGINIYNGSKVSGSNVDISNVTNGIICGNGSTISITGVANIDTCSGDGIQMNSGTANFSQTLTITNSGNNGINLNDSQLQVSGTLDVRDSGSQNIYGNKSNFILNNVTTTNVISINDNINLIDCVWVNNGTFSTTGTNTRNLYLTATKFNSGPITLDQATGTNADVQTGSTVTIRGDFTIPASDICLNVYKGKILVDGQLVANGAANIGIKMESAELSVAGVTVTPSGGFCTGISGNGSVIKCPGTINADTCNTGISLTDSTLEAATLSTVGATGVYGINLQHSTATFGSIIATGCGNIGLNCNYSKLLGNGPIDCSTAGDIGMELNVTDMTCSDLTVTGCESQNLVAKDSNLRVMSGTFTGGINTTTNVTLTNTTLTSDGGLVFSDGLNFGFVGVNSTIICTLFQGSGASGVGVHFTDSKLTCTNVVVSGRDLGNLDFTQSDVKCTVNIQASNSTTAANITLNQTTVECQNITSIGSSRANVLSTGSTIVCSGDISATGALGSGVNDGGLVLTDSQVTVAGFINCSGTTNNVALKATGSTITVTGALTTSDIGNQSKFGITLVASTIICKAGVIASNCSLNVGDVGITMSAGSVLNAASIVANACNSFNMDISGGSKVITGTVSADNVANGTNIRLVRSELTATSLSVLNGTTGLSADLSKINCTTITATGTGITGNGIVVSNTDIDCNSITANFRAVGATFTNSFISLSLNLLCNTCGTGLSLTGTTLNVSGLVQTQSCTFGINAMTSVFNITGDIDAFTSSNTGITLSKCTLNADNITVSGSPFGILDISSKINFIFISAQCGTIGLDLTDTYLNAYKVSALNGNINTDNTPTGIKLTNCIVNCNQLFQSNNSNFGLISNSSIVSLASYDGQGSGIAIDSNNSTISASSFSVSNCTNIGIRDINSTISTLGTVSASGCTNSGLQLTGTKLNATSVNTTNSGSVGASGIGAELKGVVINCTGNWTGTKNAAPVNLGIGLQLTGSTLYVTGTMTMFGNSIGINSIESNLNVASVNCNVALSPSTKFGIGIQLLSGSILNATTVTALSRSTGLLSDSSKINITGCDVSNCLTLGLDLTNTKLNATSVSTVNSPTGTTANGASINCSGAWTSTSNGTVGINAINGSIVSITGSTTTTSCGTGLKAIKSVYNCGSVSSLNCTTTGLDLSNSTFNASDINVSTNNSTTPTGITATNSTLTLTSSLTATGCTSSGVTFKNVICEVDNTIDVSSCPTGMNANMSRIACTNSISGNSCGTGLNLTQTIVQCGTIGCQSCQTGISMIGGVINSNGDVNCSSGGSFGINCLQATITCNGQTNTDTSGIGIFLDRSVLISGIISSTRCTGDHSIKCISSTIMSKENKEGNPISIDCSGNTERSVKYSNIYLIQSKISSIGSINASYTLFPASGFLMDQSIVNVGSRYDYTGEPPFPAPSVNYGLLVNECNQYALQMINGSTGNCDFIQANNIEGNILPQTNRIELSNSQLYVNGKFIEGADPAAGITARVDTGESVAAVYLYRSTMIIADKLDVSRVNQGNPTADGNLGVVTAKDSILKVGFNDPDGREVRGYISSNYFDVSVYSSNSTIDIFGGISINRGQYQLIYCTNNSRLQIVGVRDSTTNPLTRNQKYSGIFLENGTIAYISKIAIDTIERSGIKVSGNSQLRLDNSSIDNCGQSGIYFEGNSQGSISFISGGGNASYGVQLCSNSKLTELENTNTITSGGSADLQIGQNPSSVSWTTIDTTGSPTDVNDFTVGFTQMCSCVKYIATNF